jgi:hypothetical protein
MAHHATQRPALSLVHAAAALVLGLGSTNPAAADVVIRDQDIFSPFDEAVVTLEWGDVRPRFSGFVRWANLASPKIGILDTNLFNLDKVAAGDRVVLSEPFARGQELILGFAETIDGKTLYTFNGAEIAESVGVLARSPQEYLIFAPRLQGPDGQSTAMDNAMIIVRFAQLPSPGTGVFIGTLLLAASRRR